MNANEERRRKEDEMMFLKTLSSGPLIQSNLRIRMKKTFAYTVFKAILADLVELSYVSTEVRRFRGKGGFLFRITQKGIEHLAGLKGKER